MSPEPAWADWSAEHQRRIEDVLARMLPAADLDPQPLSRAMRYAVLDGGKRMRPLLAYAGGELTGADSDAVDAAAAAVELIHTYSLIHDDLPAMDDDDLRRGRPTCHKVFGEAIAILAGDALLTLAFGLVAGEDGLPADRRTAIIRELARANGSGGMVGGQAADIGAEGTTPSEEAVTFIHLRKTALPLRAALVVGALAGGASR